MIISISTSIIVVLKILFSHFIIFRLKMICSDNNYKLAENSRAEHYESGLIRRVQVFRVMDLVEILQICRFSYSVQENEIFIVIFMINL